MANLASEEELRNRIEQNLNAQPGDRGVVIAWRGYLAAVAEWGVIDLHAHGRLTQLLPANIGIEETKVMLLGLEEE